MMVDIWNVEEAQSRLLRINALIDLIYDSTERLIPLAKPHADELTTICTNMATAYDMIFDLNADLDKIINESYHRKTPGD